MIPPQPLMEQYRKRIGATLDIKTRRRSVKALPLKRVLERWGYYIGAPYSVESLSCCPFVDLVDRLSFGVTQRST